MQKEKQGICLIMPNLANIYHIREAQFVFQVKIYKMFRILSMLDETKIERTGDVLEWLFRSAMKVIGHLLR